MFILQLLVHRQTIGLDEKTSPEWAGSASTYFAIISPWLTFDADVSQAQASV